MKSQRADYPLWLVFTSYCFASAIKETNSVVFLGIPWSKSLELQISALIYTSFRLYYVFAHQTKIGTL